MRTTARLLTTLFFGAVLASAGCNDDVSSEEDARRAYGGLDLSVDKGIELGFAGFNAASSANISPQSATGDLSGTMTVTGQVDQGSSTNKGMRLQLAMLDYSDVSELTYDTDPNASVETLPSLVLNLKNIPTGTLDGTLVGTFNMAGDLEGGVTLNLAFTATLEQDAEGGVQRKVGTTHITGTATSSAGTYTVDVTR